MHDDLLVVLTLLPVIQMNGCLDQLLSPSFFPSSAAVDAGLNRHTFIHFSGLDVTIQIIGALTLHQGRVSKLCLQPSEEGSGFLERRTNVLRET